MHARSLALAAALSFLPGCIIAIDGDGMHGYHFDHDDDTLRGSGVSASESRSLPDFERVEANCSADVSIRVGSATSLSVTGDDNLLKHLRTEVRDGTLVIDMEQGSYSPRIALKVAATTPALRALSIRGSSDVDVKDLAGDRFSVEISGSGDAHGSGRVDRLEAGVAGSGDVNFASVEAHEASVQISGSGDVEVSATDSLSASIAGSGDVRYKGEPKLTQSIAGSGRVTRK